MGGSLGVQEGPVDRGIEQAMVCSEGGNPDGIESPVFPVHSRRRFCR